MDSDRHYYGVELLDTSVPGEPIVRETQEADNETELATIVASHEALGHLEPETELRIKKMKRLDAPLTDEEEQELDEWIDGLGEAETDDEPSHVPYLDDRRELRPFPEAGDILYDPESDPRYGDGRIEVVEMANDTASGYVCRYKGDTPITVADENPGHPADDPVVLAEYVEGSSRQYAFPLSRLEDVDE